MNVGKKAKVIGLDNYNQNSPPFQPPYQQFYLPPELKRWNWGAFMLNMWWGIGNRAYLPLLCLIPVFGFVWMFVCGAKGNEWAWKAGPYNDPVLFNYVQEPWTRAGKVYAICALVVLALYFLLVLFGASFLLSYYWQ